MFKQYAIGISGRDLIVEGLVSVCATNIIHNLSSACVSL